MIMPFTTYITPNRLIGAAAVRACAVSAGIIPSRSGNASVAPMPRRTVRRGIAFLVMIMSSALLLLIGRRPACLVIVKGVLRTMARMIADQR